LIKPGVDSGQQHHFVFEAARDRRCREGQIKLERRLQDWRSQLFEHQRGTVICATQIIMNGKIN
jgi:hypothetical protein